ncbi:MAG: hypothetical protein SV375_23180, partial [Thermodesulfobacteriota bacterium]|nr:hypothetical protein [Thermodesulfobacteriota bacterium]
GKFRNWNFAKNVSGEPLPVEVNKLESMVVTGLKPGRYFFAVCSYDNSMNQSDISNLAEVEVQ